MDLSREESDEQGRNTEAERKDNVVGDATGINGMVTE